MSSPPLVERVADVAGRTFDHVSPGPDRERLSRLLARLDEPLRVAVAGREKSGKSTLVNAVLGENIASTDAGVCTKVVTWYRYDLGQGLEIKRRDGETHYTPLRRDDDGRGQAIIDLGAQPSEIERVTVFLPNRALADLTIIDTPGLASMSEQLSASTRDLIFEDTATRAASEKADALIFMLSPTVMADDREALVEFTERFGGLSGSAGNALAILGRADQLGDGMSDPWAIADEIAARQGAALAGLVSTVVPLVGLLAESASHLRTSDVEHLITLASVDRQTRDDFLLLPALLLKVDCSVPVGARQRLINMLGRFGLGRALAAVDDGVRQPIKLVAYLRELSGIERVEGMVARTFRERSDVLRARAAMVELSAIAWSKPAEVADRDALRTLRIELERLENDPAMHRLVEIGAGQAAAEQIADLPVDLRNDLRLLLSETEPAARLGRPSTASRRTLMRMATEGENRWRAFANDPSTTLHAKQVARVFCRSHSLLYESLASGSGGAS